MTCGWNRRHGSEFAPLAGEAALMALATWIHLVVLPVDAAAVAVGGTAADARDGGRLVVPTLPPTALPLPILLPPPLGPTVLPRVAAPGAEATARWQPVISWAEPRAPGPREQAWLQEDRAWLAGTGAASLPRIAGPDTVAGGTGPAPDSLRRRLAVAIIARGDTIAPLRGPAAVLRDRWLARGHLQTRVVARGDTLTVAPGGSWSIGHWDVGGEDFPGRERLLEDWLLPVGSRFEASRVDDAASGLLETIGELGYPFPRWVVSDLSLDPVARTVDVKAVLLTGVTSHIGPVTSDLADPRARNFLARASGLRRGAPVRGSDLRRAVERLWSRDLWEDVGEPRVYTTSAPDTVGVHIPARARAKPNRLQVVLGLSRRGDADRARLSGEVDLRLPNLAGSGRALRVGWRDDGAGRSRFGFSWLEPLAIGTPLDASLALDSEVQDAQYTRFTTEFGARLPVVALWGLELAGGWDRSTYPEGALARTARTRARAALTHRRGDRARSGWEAVFAVESAWRSAQAREGAAGAAALAAEARQRIVAGDVAGELWLGRRAAVAARLSVRRLDGGEREATLAEHFRFGGAASLRGYGEGEFHGVEAAWAGLEWRLGSPRGSRLYTFWDVGYFGFWSAASAPAEGFERRRGWPRGFGLGLLARTPGGDLSLAVGFPGTVDFDQAKLHVTLLESF
ncbi:MAG: hypothetical protein IPK64_10105 [bacterium]|nr:hypothetical protein [bacterium]